MRDAATSRETELADAYTRSRPRLTRIAYAMLGSRAEAEDVVSDCWLRLVRADGKERIRDLEAWATVAVAHAALDVLRSARARREEYVGPWLPEPVVETGPSTDPADLAARQETVGYAVMVVLETLTPAERTAWVLHELFGMPYQGVADVVGRSTAAVRQLAARARAHVAAGAPRMHVDSAEHRRAVAAFTHAASGGDVAGLVRTLDPSVVLTSDGGGEVRAARKPVRGAERVARFMIRATRRVEARQWLVDVTVNGDPGFAIVEHGRIAYVGSLTVQDGAIRRVDLVLAPDKLARLPEIA